MQLKRGQSQLKDLNKEKVDRIYLFIETLYKGL